MTSTRPKGAGSSDRTVLAQSFTEWLTLFAEKLHRGDFKSDDEEGLWLRKDYVFENWLVKRK